MQLEHRKNCTSSNANMIILESENKLRSIVSYCNISYCRSHKRRWIFLNVRLVTSKSKAAFGCTTSVRIPREYLIPLKRHLDQVSHGLYNQLDSKFHLHEVVDYFYQKTTFQVQRDPRNHSFLQTGNSPPT